MIKECRTKLGKCTLLDCPFIALAVSLFRVDGLSNVPFTPSSAQGFPSHPMLWAACPHVQTRCSYSCAWCGASMTASRIKECNIELGKRLLCELRVEWFFRISCSWYKDVSLWACVSVDLPCVVAAATYRCSCVHCTVLSSLVVFLCSLVDWAWWSWRADRLEIYIFFSQHLHELRVLLPTILKRESRILDSSFRSYLSWE